MHCETYDVITGTVREENVLKLKTAFVKQRNFFLNIKKSSEDAVKTSFLISEMIAKSSKNLLQKALLLKSVLLKQVKFYVLIKQTYLKA